MVLGHGHLRGLLGLESFAPDQIEARARDCTRRFMRAFAP
jgi:TetR/AcrR family transcriptional repressor of mexJK operon